MPVIRTSDPLLPPANAHEEAIRRYQGYRDYAMEAAWDKWNVQLKRGGVDLKLLPIDGSALQFWSSVWSICNPPGGVRFPWNTIYRRVRSTPRRFDLAIWDGSILCGLAVGVASRGKIGQDTNLTMKFLERLGDPPIGPPMNSIRGYVATIALDVAYAYAQTLDKKWLYLQEPLPGAVPKYEELGFSLVKTQKSRTYYGIAVE